MTLRELIEELQTLETIWGGNAPVEMVDGEPVFIAVHTDDEDRVTILITDIEDMEEDEDE